MSRLIDADVFAKNVVKYSHQSTKTIGQALADTPTVKAVSIEVLQEIRAEIADLDDADYDYEGYYKAVCDALDVIDKHLNKSGFEIWNSIHGERIVVPKGTFMQIYNDDEEENDVI